jgi:hypothetical protein
VEDNGRGHPRRYPPEIQHPINRAVS